MELLNNLFEKIKGLFRSQPNEVGLMLMFERLSDDPQADGEKTGATLKECFQAIWPDVQLAQQPDASIASDGIVLSLIFLTDDVEKIPNTIQPAMIKFFEEKGFKLA